MGKLIYFITALIFIDLFFVATGQICVEGSCSLSSTVFNAIFRIQESTFTSWFAELIGDFVNNLSSETGFLALIVGGAVAAAGVLLSRSDFVLSLPIAFTLAVISADFTFIASYLIEQNEVLAFFVMAPILVIYILTVLEWAKGKD